MRSSRSKVIVMCAVVELFIGVAMISAAAIPSASSSPVANIAVGNLRIDWVPTAGNSDILLTIVGPNGFRYTKNFASGALPTYELKPGQADGQYFYELRVSPAGPKKTRDGNNLTALTAPGIEAEAITQSGVFTVGQGVIIPDNLPEPTRSTLPDTKGQSPLSRDRSTIGVLDIVQADDVIVTGSLCVGFDCVNGENFGFDTIRMKENNLRLKFDDTSATAGFPANDWQITANDSGSGGANYLSFDDITGSKVPFKVIAGARTNSLFVSSTGRVGLGTSVPVLNLHITAGDTPSTRLEQDTTSGWTAQTWDIAGNESNFFVRDTTGGSKLPFRIQPGTPTNTLTMKADGKVGIGTWSPISLLHIATSETWGEFRIERIGGATGKIQSGTANVQFGSVTDHEVRVMVNNTWRMKVKTDNSLELANGATCTAGGVWTNASSRAFKENINQLSAEEATAALEELNPVKYNYKAAKSEKHVGFIAEDVPDLVATQDRTSLSPMDIVAVLTKVVQEQQKTIKELEDRINNLEQKK